MVQIANLAGIQGQDIQKVKGDIDRIISKIHRQNVDPVGVGLNVIPYRCNYPCFQTRWS